MTSGGLVEPERVIGLAQNLVRIRSPLWGESEIAKYLAAFLDGIGLEVRVQEVSGGDGQRSHQTIARWRGAGAGPKVLLCGHLDTEGAGEEIYRPGHWTHSHYGGEVVDGWLYGMGSVNMKCGVAAMVCAVEALMRNGFTPRGEIVIAAVMGETGGGVGVQHLLRTESDFDMAIVTEPTDLDLATISVGTAQGWVKLWGGISHCEPYANPISGMARVLDAFGPSYKPLQPDSWVTFDPCPDLPGYPRLAVRRIVSGQHYAEIFFDMRIVPGQNDESVRRDLTSLLATLDLEKAGYEVEITIPAKPDAPNFPAMPATPAGHPLVEILAHSHEKVTGRLPRVGAGSRLGFAADSGQLKAVGVTTVEYGPGAHPVWPMVDERILTEDILISARVLTEALRDLSG